MEAAILLVLVGTALGAAAVVRWRRRRRPSGGGESPQGDFPSSDRLARGLLATRRRLGAQLAAVLSRGGASLDAQLAALEEVLVAADVGVRTASRLVHAIRERLPSTSGPEGVLAALAQEMERLLAAAPPAPPVSQPWIVVVAGVNGAGKTTTIGKLAALHRAAGRRVLIVAADTFRAAAIDQLGVWATRTGAELVRHGPGGDPAAVVFDGMKAARARNVDVVLVDTAGRLHTRMPLMDELRKLHRVIAREIPGAPHEVLLVLDATTGQNAVAQARSFVDAIGVSGVVLAKLDGTARGGVVLAIADALALPIRYVGVGEQAEDLRPFDARAFVAAILGPAGSPPGATPVIAAGEGLA